MSVCSARGYSAPPSSHTAPQLGRLTGATAAGAQPCPELPVETPLCTGVLPGGGAPPSLTVCLTDCPHACIQHTRAHRGPHAVNTPAGHHTTGCRWHGQCAGGGHAGWAGGGRVLGAASGGPLALQAGSGCPGVRFCSLRVGALEEKAGLCRGAAWPVWPRLPGPSQGTLGATLEPFGL